jgi:hypothetical protein
LNPVNDNDEDSNAADEDFKIDEDYKDKVADEIALEVEDGSVGNNDPDLQEDYFQTPIQQHNNDVLNNNEPISEIIPRSSRGNDPVVTLSNTTIHTEKQECGKQKKKKAGDEITSMEENLEDYNISNPNNTKVGVSEREDAQCDNIEHENDDTTPKELESDLGPYWTLAQSTHAYVLSTITSYSSIEASKSTPQYGFNRGLKEFGTPGYEATVKELDDNLLGMGAVRMLEPSKLNKNIWFEALNYLMFLKRLFAR